VSRHFCQALCVGVATAFLAGCGGSQPPISALNTGGISSRSHRTDALLSRVKRGTGPSGYISNVIVIIQENRSFENFFAGYPGANAPTYGCGLPTNGKRSNAPKRQTSTGCPVGDQVIPLHQVTFEKEPNLSHLFEAGIIDWNNGNMDGFTNWGRGAHLHDAAYAYIEPSEVAPYWTMAQQYVLADNMFPTEFGPSWTGHLTLVAGTDSLSSDVALADFATGSHSNCKAAAGTHTTIVNSERVVQHGTGPYPCLDQFNTMAQVLDAASVSWKYYANRRTRSSIWSPFAAIKYVYEGADWDNNVVVPQTRVLTDIAQGKLASVSWVTPSHRDSDHPGAHDDDGPSWVSSIVNAVGQSSYWNSTAIIVTWDDWGGFYDNAAPPQLDFRGLGIRVPCLIISPYAKKGVVVHTQYEYGSILKFIREVFALPPIGSPSQGYTDERANSLSDSFDFTKAPRRFHPIHSKYPIQRFLNERPSSEPVDEE
jgi:phospholipase C